MTATPTHFQVGPENTGLWHTRQTEDAAKTVSSLLQKDLESHHVFFNDGGFHNHISHHLLSLYGTGASSADLQKAYDDNKDYQRPARAPHADEGEQEATEGRSSISVSNDDGTGKKKKEEGGRKQDDWYADTGSALLGRQSYYADFLRFFQQEMAVGGNSWRTVVTSRLLAGTPAADDLLVRLFAGFLHPLIQLQYGLEWEQPAAVAQGLAQACVHRVNGLDDFLLRSEKAAAAKKESTPNTPTILSLFELFEAVAASPQLSTAARFEDGNKLDGVLTRAADALVDIAARVHVLPTEADVAARTAEMAETCVFVAAAAALHPHKQPKFDFFLIHHVTSIPFFVALNKLDWVPAAAKARLLEWKIRLDLAQYAARACPPLGRQLDALRAYGRQPAQVAQDTQNNSAAPDSISQAAAAAAARLFNINDDGHAIKLVLGTGLAEEIVRPFADASWRILRDQALWENIYRLEVDSVLEPGIRWVRSTGFDEAWEEVADLP